MNRANSSFVDEPAELGERYLPARRVWERLGISHMTLARWLKKPEMGFPRPHYFGRYRFFKLSDLIAWENAQAARVDTDDHAAA